ncbi:MAG: hypothetical protein ACOCUL_01030 [Bacteroidota bacterium]
MENNFKQRFMQLLNYLNLRPSQFAGVLGYKSPEKINRLLRAKSERGCYPGFEILRDIANTFVYINMNWLLTGKGDMLVNFEKEKKYKAEDKISEKYVPKQKYINVLEENLDLNKELRLLQNKLNNFYADQEKSDNS